MKKRIAIILVAALALTACTSENVTVTLEAAVDAAIAAAGIFETISGVSPQTQAAVGTYLSLAQACVTDAVTTLSDKTETPAAQVAKIAASCAASAQSTLPAGTPQNVVLAVTAVSNAITAFLTELHSTSVTSVNAFVLTSPAMVSAFANKPGAAAPHLNQRRLKRIHEKVLKLQQKTKKKD